MPGRRYMLVRCPGLNDSLFGLMAGRPPSAEKPMSQHLKPGGHMDDPQHVSPSIAQPYNGSKMECSRGHSAGMSGIRLQEAAAHAVLFIGQHPNSCSSSL